MTITGQQLIGNNLSASNDNFFSAVDPKTGKELPEAFYEATAEEVDQAVRLAEKAFESYRKKQPTEIATFLDQIAEEIMALGDTLIDRAMQETALPEGRLKGERGRTVNQLKLFAEVVREGSWVDARIDQGDPGRQPAPKPDVRQMLRPLGPVGVFGASNFPLAFSVAGGDTASALAAGCTVVIKGHPAHPGTSELVGQAMLEAARKTGMPEGVCSLIQGVSHAVGEYLVGHPLIQAIGFTGSFRGGKALFDLANRRPSPIPVFAEMGSVNPVFVLPGALKERGKAIAEGLAGSVMLGVGQFCTNPGLVFLPGDDASTNFKSTLSWQIEHAPAGTMLTSSIKHAFEHRTATLGQEEGMTLLAMGQVDETANSVPAQIFSTTLDHFEKEEDWGEEVFGPSSILVEAPTREQLLRAARNMEGHLTATVHGTEADLEAYHELFEILERKVGRLIVNGYPTGVEVCHAMVHGGPFPATTAPQTTSVGTNAIRRFARPVCYQDFPGHLLPAALQEDNPVGIWRLVDGKWMR